MATPTRDALHPAPRLSCLVAGGSATLALELAERLERSCRVGRVERLADAIALEHALLASPADLVVWILGAPDEPLPRCLRTRADLRVLVVAPEGVVGTLSRWLQQGATDLVSPDDEDGLAHALSRLLDECTLAAMVRRLDTVIATQRERLTALRHRTPAAAAHSPAQLRGEHRPLPLTIELPKTEPPEVVPGANARPPRRRDRGDGLPGRRESLKRLIALQARAHGAEASRPTIALQIGLPFGDGDSRLDRTLGDLAVCRAAERLRTELPRRLLLGRSRRDTLVVLIANDGPDGCERPTEALVARLRRAMGSLGELLDDEADLVIDVLEGPLASLAVPDLLERLERRRDRRRLAEEFSAGHGSDVVQVLPVLTATVRPPPRRAARARPDV